MGCVMHETYGDSDVTAADSAHIEGYWHYFLFYDEDMQIVSVDGKRKREDGWFHAYSVSLPPGAHWIQLAVLRNGGEIARCAFEGTFDARHRYKITRLHHDQFLLAHPASSPFKASISLEVTAPTAPSQSVQYPATCAQAALCRQDSDCPRTYSCRTDADFGFGTCKTGGH